MGIVKRIEYDPNRSSWIALVPWIEGVLCSRKCFALSKAKKFDGPFNSQKERYRLYCRSNPQYY